MIPCPLGCGKEHPYGWSHELYAAGRMLRALKDEYLSWDGELEVLAIVTRYWLDTGRRRGDAAKADREPLAPDDSRGCRRYFTGDGILCKTHANLADC